MLKNALKLGTLLTKAEAKKIVAGMSMYECIANGGVWTGNGCDFGDEKLTCEICYCAHPQTGGRYTDDMLWCWYEEGDKVDYTNYYCFGGGYSVCH